MQTKGELLNFSMRETDDFYKIKFYAFYGVTTLINL